jgi:hypothetical protein
LPPPATATAPDKLKNDTTDLTLEASPFELIEIMWNNDFKKYTQIKP